MLNNKDIGFEAEKNILMINGATYDLASPEALDDLAEDVGANTTAIEGLDARVTALEEGGASKTFVKLTEGTINTVNPPGSYGRIIVELTGYDEFILLIKKESESAYTSLYIDRVPVLTDGIEVAAGVFRCKRWSASDLRLGVNCSEGGTVNYILYAR